MKTVCISGYHGFIGSHLARALSVKGLTVVPVPQSIIYSPKDLYDFFHTHNPDYIFHLGAYGNMAHQKDPALTIFSNVLGTFNMLKESLDINYRAFINFGSSSEYGKKYLPMAETDVLNPETFYGASKAAATHLAYVFARQYDKPILTVRPFSVYGPGEAPFRFIPTVINSMLENKVFTLEEKANHDWIYIDDFIEALLIVTDKAGKFPGGIVNLGSGRMHSNKDVCEALKRISGIQYLATSIEGMRMRDSELWMSDNTLINSLGWYPRHMLAEGLSETYEWYKKQRAEKKDN